MTNWRFRWEQIRVRERGSSGRAQWDQVGPVGAWHGGVDSGSDRRRENSLRRRGREVKAGGTDYLLSPMRKMQLQELDEGLDQAVRAVEMILKDGAAKAMNEFNRRVSGEAEDAPGK